MRRTIFNMHGIWARGSGIKVLIAAGGSGGHIFPAVALARRLREREKEIDILFVGSDKVLDKRIFEREGLPYFLISGNSLPYRISVRTILFFLRLVADTIASLYLVVSYRPDVVVGFGGYVSWPVTSIACLFGIPKLVHEQNVRPGRSNRVLFGLADKIAVTFDETRAMMGASQTARSVVTGNPIRTSDFSGFMRNGVPGAGKDRDCLKRMGLVEGRFTVLVIGGSQGAHFLNTTFVEALAGLGPEERSALQAIHITGLADYEWASAEYRKIGVESRVYSFIDRIEDAYAASDLIITRSGASAIFEIAFFGKPMILVPYPFANGHQAENAMVFGKREAAIVIYEKDLSADTFRDTLRGLLRDRAKLDRMASSARSVSVPDASDRLASEVLGLSGRR